MLFNNVEMILISGVCRIVCITQICHAKFPIFYRFLHQSHIFYIFNTPRLQYYSCVFFKKSLQQRIYFITENNKQYSLRTIFFSFLKEDCFDDTNFAILIDTIKAKNTWIPSAENLKIKLRIFSTGIFGALT